MHTEKELDALRVAVARLEGDSFFLASTLASYRTQFRLNDHQVAKMLSCSAEGLVSLALCRAPRLEDEKLFLADIQKIAKYAGCDWAELARIVRAVQSLTTLKQFTGATENQLLKAARDKVPKSDDPEKPRSRKR